MSDFDSSDDEFSYTNTASLLKKMTNKCIAEEVDTSIDSPGPVIEERKARIKEKSPEICEVEVGGKKNTRRKKDSEVVPEVDLCLTPVCEEICKNTQDSCVVVSENELDESFNIISKIDECLKRNNSRRTPRGKRKTRGRGRGSKRSSSPIATRSKRRRSTNVIETIEIDPDYPTLNSAPSLPDDVNYECSVKVLWKSQHLERFTIRRFEKLDAIFKFFSEKESICEERLLFTLKNKIVSKLDTPYSLEITAASIIEGGTLSEKSYLSSGIEYNSGTVEFKVQMRDRKKPIVVNMKATDTMEVLMSQCAQELNLPISGLKFYFDGDVILATDSPVSLQLEGGECIDCFKQGT